MNYFYHRTWPGIIKGFQKELNRYTSLTRSGKNGTIGQLQLINKFNCLVKQNKPKAQPEWDGLPAVD
ncbi:hypothetical protein [Larkinella terrae]|uniref:Uncharacterized protein n=1 Tax=Larkinella terrae TaxID=2025311 RepID=A0A7K0ES01_9BACT|nr:hypothetical protein [Larkinella terrae]MRS64542.1 hypothetical protein [Larkinella terrae]